MHSQRRRQTHDRQRGLSIVELMVASVIGLFIVAGATQFFVAHVQAHRRVLLESRLHQDLRAATDLITRGLRRAGYWQAALDNVQGTGGSNPYRHIETAERPATQTTFSYSRNSEDGLVDRKEATGFRRSADALQTLTGGAWQGLTDASTVQVTRLTVTPAEEIVPLGHLCEPACAPTDAACPRMRLRSYRIDITGRSTSDPMLTRELHTTVRVRNDDIGLGRCLAP